MGGRFSDRFKQLTGRSRDKAIRVLPNGNEYFRHFPSELLDCLGEFMSEVDRAALALTSRCLLKKLGSVSLRLDEQPRFNLLKRLCSDNMCMEMILCPTCRIFHLPRRSRDWSQAEGARPCVNFGDRWMLAKTTSSNLPIQINFDMIAAIVRNHQHEAKHYGTELLQSSCHHQHDGGHDARINVHVSAQVAFGDLMLKTEKILSVGSDRRKALRVVPQLLDMLQTSRELGDCCEHVQWHTALRLMFELKKKPNPGKEPCEKSTSKHKCPWTHNTTCPYSALGCTGSQSRARLRILGCHRCCTDYTISICTSPEGANVLVLTSWKNLGDGKRLSNESWLTHLEHDEGCTAALRVCSPGGIYKECEMERGRVSRGPYEPNLEWWMLQGLLE